MNAHFITELRGVKLFTVYREGRGGVNLLGKCTVSDSPALNYISHSLQLASTRFRTKWSHPSPSTNPTVQRTSPKNQPHPFMHQSAPPPSTGQQPSAISLPLLTHGSRETCASREKAWASASGCSWEMCKGRGRPNSLQYWSGCSSPFWSKQRKR